VKREAGTSGTSGTAGRIEGGQHVLPVRVYYEDTDMAGIVYYANYLKFAERGRTEMLRLVGIQQGELARREGLTFAVRDCNVDYRQPAKLDDLIEVRSRLIGLRAASAEAEQLIYRDGTALARLGVRIACIDREGRPARIPATLRVALETYLEPREQR
jgi:acyl-CoA thioester hydrolase